MGKVLLYSGGTDSWLINKLYKPDKKIYINIHGTYSQDEIVRLPKDVEIIDFPYLGTIEDKATDYVPLRNLYFLMVATNYGNDICYGATLSDRGSADKREEFIDKAENVINYALNGNSAVKDRHIHIERKYVKMHKFQIIQEYLDNGGTIEEFVKDSFSCYRSVNGKECMHCKQCYKKFMEAFYFGYKYDKQTEKDMIEYLKTKVIPKGKQQGTYFTERPGEGPYMEKAMDMLFSKYNMNWKDFQ